MIVYQCVCSSLINGALVEPIARIENVRGWALETRATNIGRYEVRSLAKNLWAN